MNLAFHETVAPVVRCAGTGGRVDVTRMPLRPRKSCHMSAANASSLIPVVPDAVGIAGVVYFALHARSRRRRAPRDWGRG